MRKWILLGLVFAGLVALLPVGAMAGETVTYPGSYFPEPGNRKIDGDLWVTGDIHTGAAKTDGSVFLSAYGNCVSDTPTTFLPVRLAANNWALARTAAAPETINYTCNGNSWLQRYGAVTGLKIRSMAMVYQITVVDATSHTFNAGAAVTYANGSAVTVGSYPMTATLATASTTHPYLSTVTVTTPVYFPSVANTAANLDATIVLATTGVFRLYGVQVNFTRSDD